MEYSINRWPIQQLYDLIKAKKIDLRPSYQRNFVWTKKDQQLLIDSILKNWPLPTFFLYKKDDGTYEMVDGQQRAETICRFIKYDITDSQKRDFSNINSSSFMKYELNVTIISKINDDTRESISEFYALVNKRGMHLNSAEVNKAQYGDHPFMKLAEKLMSSPEFSKLDFLTNATISRMNDRTLIEELLAYLYKGIFDKRDVITEIYESNISDDTIDTLKDSFMRVIRRIDMLNEEKPIKETRLRQRNDFFTFFTFIHKNESFLTDDLLLYQYNLLCWIDTKGFIRPSNEDCELLQKYAFACVTQSNSKDSRMTRLKILETILLNRSNSECDDYEVFLEFLKDEFRIENIPVKKINDFLLIDYKSIND